jgi:hypothetical protein
MGEILVNWISAILTIAALIWYWKVSRKDIKLRIKLLTAISIIAALFILANIIYSDLPVKNKTVIEEQDSGETRTRQDKPTDCWGVHGERLAIESCSRKKP